MADARVADVVTLGEDVHRHVAAQLRLQSGQAKSLILPGGLVCTSVPSHGGSPKSDEKMLRDNPDIAYARTNEHGYALLTITAKQIRCDFQSIPQIEQANAWLHASRRYAVERGRAGVRVCN